MDTNGRSHLYFTDDCFHVNVKKAFNAIEIDMLNDEF